MTYCFASLSSENPRNTTPPTNPNAHSLAPSYKQGSSDKDKDKNKATFSLHCWDQKAAEGRGRVSLGL